MTGRDPLVPAVRATRAAADKARELVAAGDVTRAKDELDDAQVVLADAIADARKAAVSRNGPPPAAAAGTVKQEERRNGALAPESAVPPQNLEAEESVLGAIMLAPAAIASARRLLQDDGRQFYRESHAKIYQAALALHDQGEPVDAITIVDELQQRGQLEAVGGRVRVHELAALVPATANVGHYAKIVAGSATLRDLIKTGAEISRLGWDRPGELDELVDRARQAVHELEQQAPREPIRISWGKEFLTQQTDQVDVLLGSGDDKVLPAAGFCLVYGKGGQGKTTLTLTAVAALASATAWLGINVNRPVRCCMIENEGPKAPFIQKVSRFADQWDGPDFLQNVALYEEPWGRFSVTDRGMRDDLLAFTRDQKIDVVVAGPLRGLGIEGPGAPSETDAFLNLLKDAGLGTELAWWIVHHTNKQNQISGDWDRQPDLLLRLTYEGKRRNRLQFEKIRWGDQGREPLILEWLDDGVGYRIIDTSQDDEIDWLDLEQRVLNAVADQPGCAQSTVEKTLDGKATRIREAVRRLLDSGRLTDAGKGGKKVLTITENVPPTLPTDGEELEWQ
jgi:hypothetical protein